MSHVQFWTRMILAMTIALSIACAGLMVSWPPAAGGGIPPAESSGNVDAVATAVVSLVNQERSRAGLPPLATDARLARAAQIQADQMAHAGVVAHDLPGTRYPSLESRLAAVSYDWSMIAENLASGQSDAAEAVSDWMRSPGHRANILSRGARATGAAVSVDSKGVPYYTQVFAAPR